MLVARPGRADRFRQSREFAQQRTGPRGSMISSTQNSRRTEWRAQPLEAILDLLAAWPPGSSARRRCRRDRPLRCRLPAAASPIGRWPRIAQRQAVRRLMHGACDAERIAHDDGAPGHRVWFTAAMARTPWRMVAAFSASSPIRNPDSPSDRPPAHGRSRRDRRTAPPSGRLPPSMSRHNERDRWPSAHGPAFEARQTRR